MCATCYSKKSDEAGAEPKKKKLRNARRAGAEGKGRACTHNDIYSLVKIDCDYVVSSYADKVRAGDSDNHLPTNCASCKGKFV